MPDARIRPEDDDWTNWRPRKRPVWLGLVVALVLAWIGFLIVMILTG
jgi:hypothetical protein